MTKVASRFHCYTNPDI